MIDQLNGTMNGESNNNNNVGIENTITNSTTTTISPTTPTTILTPIQPPYVPIKGKGKGNRKPRINFISVINGITVGADGIRRKFHCSHCGNGMYLVF